MRSSLLGVILLLVSCSTVTDLDLTASRRADYESYLNKNLKSQRLYLKLRETAAGKALRVTPRLSELQAKVVPGFEARNTEGLSTFIVSLEMPDWSRFSIADFKFYWGETPVKAVREIMDGQLLQTLYPFAVPHDRAFILDFEGGAAPGAQRLRVQTSQGEFNFEFSEGA